MLQELIQLLRLGQLTRYGQHLQKRMAEGLPLINIHVMYLVHKYLDHFYPQL
jgi:hypothetical protein